MTKKATESSTSESKKNSDKKLKKQPLKSPKVTTKLEQTKSQIQTSKLSTDNSKVNFKNNSIFWEYTSYYIVAVVLENFLSFYLGNLGVVLTLAVTALQIYLINKATDLKQFGFKTAFQFTLLMSLVGGFIAGVVQSIIYYTIGKDTYSKVYEELKNEYSKAGIDENTTNNVISIVSNPIFITTMYVLGGLFFGLIVGLIMGSIAKSKLNEQE